MEIIGEKHFECSHYQIGLKLIKISHKNILYIHKTLTTFYLNYIHIYKGILKRTQKEKTKQIIIIKTKVKHIFIYECRHVSSCFLF